jgi:hypothetical protein
LAVLKDLVETGDADVGEILRAVVRTCLVDGVVDDVVDRADRQVDVEEIATKLLNAAIGTVADEGQAEDGLPEPIFGHRNVAEHLIVGDRGREGVGQSGLSAVT